MSVGARPELRVEDIDFNDLEFWARPMEEREAAFQLLRRQVPVPFFEEPEEVAEFFPVGPGYYVLTRHADILEASRRPEEFCSGRSATSIPDMPEEFLHFFGSMINMDDPRHARLRRIVSRGFTPRMLKKVEDQVQQVASSIVDEMLETGEGDFVVDGRRQAPAEDHLRHDRHPGRASTSSSSSARTSSSPAATPSTCPMT